MVPVINADTLTLANFLRPDLPPWSTASVNFTDSKTGLFFTYSYFIHYVVFYEFIYPSSSQR